jgi:1-acyl-sn-glycerol-3-phosphate acyltransferase
MRAGRHRGWFRVCAFLVKPFLWTCTRPTWRGLDNIPREGGVIVVANHVTIVDPLTLAHAIYDGARRTPSFLAKSELFKLPVIGTLLRKAGQIPVYRRTRDAVNSLRDAEAAVADGECVIIYPEGTCTRDPDGWPMLAKTGVARLVLASDVPVIPMASWGTQRILRYGSKRPHPFPPKRVLAVAGPPVDLSAYRAVEPTNEVLREITDLLMTRVTGLLAELRDETPPSTFYEAKPTPKPTSESSSESSTESSSDAAAEPAAEPTGTSAA